ncbi:hypothetical protein [Spirosoma sordidisoli]|uniref:Uncharacterized protein n=1 Tax=Spirosoma sordidisoli TaxID=2502893 RepID=A0A4Q2UHL2_9BACT|nr:hypothetical protein [Spirosoma sordidisoli]RYC68897.1 hypothetical protein EQG79_15945 [Spirosoma sordidisoli]
MSDTRKLVFPPDGRAGGRLAETVQEFLGPVAQVFPQGGQFVQAAFQVGFFQGFQQVVDAVELEGFQRILIVIAPHPVYVAPRRSMWFDNSKPALRCALVVCQPPTPPLWPSENGHKGGVGK